jgi:hypothetical protein
LEVGKAGEAARSLDNGASLAGVIGEGDEGAALFVTAIAVASKPDGTASGWFARFIEDGDYFASAGRSGEEVKLALANDGPATLAAANEFDDPYPAPVFDLGKLEITGDAALWGILVFEGAFVVGYQSVKSKVSTDLGAVLKIVIEGVHLKDLHDQGLHVLEMNAEPDVVADAEVLGTAGSKLDVYPVLEGLELVGAQQGGPALGITNPIDNLGFSKDGLEPFFPEIRSIIPVIYRFSQEVKEIAPDHRFVSADGS